MTLAFAPGVARVTVHMTVGGRGVANVFHVARAGIAGAPLAQADVDAIALGVRNAYKNRFLILQASALTLGQVLAQDLSNDVGPTGVATGSNTGGDTPHAPHPNNVAMCLTWQQASHWRGGHPRTYLPGIPSNANSDSTTWAAATITAWQAAAANFMSDVYAISLGSYSGSLGVLRRTRHGVKIDPAEFHNFTGVTIDSRIDSQRRRLGPDR